MSKSKAGELMKEAAKDKVGAVKATVAAAVTKATALRKKKKKLKKKLKKKHGAKSDDSDANDSGDSDSATSSDDKDDGGGDGDSATSSDDKDGDSATSSDDKDDAPVPALAVLENGNLKSNTPRKAVMKVERDTVEKESMSSMKAQAETQTTTTIAAAKQTQEKVTATTEKPKAGDTDLKPASQVLAQEKLANDPDTDADTRHKLKELQVVSDGEKDLGEIATDKEKTLLGELEQLAKLEKSDKSEKGEIRGTKDLLTTEQKIEKAEKSEVEMLKDHIKDETTTMETTKAAELIQLLSHNPLHGKLATQAEKMQPCYDGGSHDFSDCVTWG